MKFIFSGHTLWRVFRSYPLLDFLGLIRIWLILLPFIMGLACSGYSQDLGERSRWFSTQDTIRSPDTLSLVPGSLRILQPAGISPKIYYDLNENILLLQGENLPDSVKMAYRVFPFNFSQKVSIRDRAIYDSIVDSKIPFFYPIDNQVPVSREELFDLPGIQKSGNISRGLTFGSNQDASVNSALNLQLEGQLTKDISVLAAISDQNIPFQPEGNTQQLQELDRVFVQFSHKRGKLTVGDVVLRNPDNHFLKYYKNIQGGFLETQYPVGSDSEAETRVGAAVSKGKFASISVQPIEGVLGPYRLTGPNNETFIIVLSNSEKVYLDGRLMTRGFNEDYVIDYNQAEITFNSNVLITQFSRIRVDFEFSERNYNRTIIAGSHYQNYKKLDFFINFYQASDSPRNPLINLSTDDINELGELGDSLSLIDGVDSVGFNPDQVRYKRIDTLGPVTGIIYPDVFVVSSEPELAQFDVSFTDVGFGQGDYIRSTSTVNGRTFQWVEPDANGNSQGNFAPVRTVPLPNSQQMITLGAAYNFTENESVYFEAAFSDQDLNRFSNLDDEDNQGQALKIGYKNLGKPLDKLPDYQWQLEIDYEWDNRLFRPIDRFRSIEYNRDWSIRNDTIDADDKLLHAAIGLFKNSNNQFRYDVTRRQRQSLTQGWQHRLNFRKELGRWLMYAQFFRLDNDLGVQDSQWQRISGGASYRWNRARSGYEYSQDKNTIRLGRNDSVQLSQMYFEQHRAFWQSADSARFIFLADYVFRRDFQPFEGEIVPSIRSHNANFSWQGNWNQNQSLGLQFTYRLLENLRDSADNSNSNLQGRLDWNASFWERHLRSKLTYTTATGQELRREFEFIEVLNGEGTHTWRDLNEDGIQDLNEFFLAVNPDERNFVKIFIPTNDFVRAFTNTFVWRLNWTAPRNWRRSQGLKKVLGLWSGIVSWRINRRISEDRLLPRLLPFAEVADESILSTREAFRSTVFMNRSNPKYGLELNFNQNRQRQLLTDGFEETRRQSYSVTSRSNLGGDWNLQLRGERSDLRTRSDFLLTRNYLIRTYDLGPEIAFQPSNSFRVSLNYRYRWKDNLESLEMEESSRIQEFSLETRLAQVSKRNILGFIRFIRIDLTGDPNSPVGYELLEALQPGTNWTWGLNLQQRLANGLQISLNYDGRRSQGARVIHTARMQVTALF